MLEIPGGSLTLLGIYLMGLGLNLTPCVYPMMSVTVSVFGGQKDVHHWKAFGKAFLYVLGIATMYSLLGVAAAITGEMFGALLQNKWVLLGISIALLILALSMFGLYTFQIPAWLVNKIGGHHKMNLLGIYISGLFVGIFAAPCIGPPIIALLTFVGTRGEPAFAFMIFFVLSLGLGTPYLVLGTFSSLLHKLPRSGVWMVWVERLFGMILLSFAAFYALLAFRPQGLALWLPVSVIATGAYLGFIEKAGDEQKRFRLFKRTIGTVVILIGFLIPILGPKDSVVWAVYTPDTLAEAKTSGKPVIMDFYADWCLPCHELDQFTYTNAQVITALDGFERIKVDLTSPDDEQTLDLISRFQIVGVPTILFLDVQGLEIEEARITGYISPEGLLAILNSPEVSGRISGSPQVQSE